MEHFQCLRLLTLGLVVKKSKTLGDRLSQLLRSLLNVLDDGQDNVSDFIDFSSAGLVTRCGFDHAFDDIRQRFLERNGYIIPGSRVQLPQPIDEDFFHLIGLLLIWVLHLFPHDLDCAFRFFNFHFDVLGNLVGKVFFDHSLFLGVAEAGDLTMEERLLVLRSTQPLTSFCGCMRSVAIISRAAFGADTDFDVGDIKIVSII